ncbi:signal peptidase I [Collinsella sp. AGMB00827]|uniref:Signal peptidase I n=1 Tax=Collinsella ureilytica TaxID=2869515 RepID=A0ABS7MIM0_9ACTN|nr:signal peptidase I [Collinsella urealyticum]MBY4797132.1 signal peptidase I [Collinsella urealyticum]
MRKGREQKNIATARPLSADIASLLFKVAFVGALFLGMFSFIFGAFRCADISMSPSIKDGDMVLDYRLDKNFHLHDVAAFTYEGTRMAARVVALPGDEVAITADGLVVNGSVQQESGVYGSTTQVAQGITFPLTVGDGQIFVLGDNREQAIDSRIFGCVDVAHAEGKVVAILRTRAV